MLMSFSEFARYKKLSLRWIQQLALDSCGRHIEVDGVRYKLLEHGRHDANGKPHFKVLVNELRPQRRHLADSEKAEIFTRASSGEDLHALAREYGVDFTTVYRIRRDIKTARKRRSDAGKTKADWVPRNARKIFEGVYLSNAQRNARIALQLTGRELGGVKLPYRLGLFWASKLKAMHTLTHQAARFESEATPHIRRDLWGEYGFMEQVVFDCWKADLWVKNGSTQVQPRLVVAIDLKTRMLLSEKTVSRDVNGHDVLDVCLDVVAQWGRPDSWLLDNGTEFQNQEVQRFLRGLYTSDEHDRDTHILSSEAYHPQSKGSLERLFRIFKDEFCSFTSSYSPNPVESRKPTKKLSHVEGDMTLKEFEARFMQYLRTGFFMTREREMWMDPAHTPSSHENTGRPRTMEEAFNRAYATYQRVDVDATKLAFLYAKTFKKRIRRGMISVTYAGGRYLYIPDQIPDERATEVFNVLVNPLDMSKAWVLDLGGNVITTASEPRLSNTVGGIPMTRERASQVKKIRNRIVKHTRDAARLKREVDGLSLVIKGEAVNPSPIPDASSVKEIYASISVPEDDVCDLLLKDPEYLAAAIRAQDEELREQ